MYLFYTPTVFVASCYKVGLAVLDVRELVCTVWVKRPIIHFSQIFLTTQKFNRREKKKKN